jgi:enoyl-CoA hydratase
MMIEFKLMHLEKRGDVALLTLDRPPVNALNKELLTELFSAIGAVSGMDGIRAMVLTGKGKAFVAGADIAQMQGLSVADAGAFSSMGQAVFSGLEALPFPVIAAVNGFALGGGCELAMACDFIIAGPKALFGQPEVKLGLIPGFGGTQRLTRLVGVQRAKELCYTGRNVGADEAVAMGLALAKSEGDVTEDAIGVAEVIAANGPYAVSLAKRAINESEGASPAAGYAIERNLFAMCFGSEDQTEGVAAFLEKRSPTFKGS